MVPRIGALGLKGTVCEWRTPRTVRVAVLAGYSWPEDSLRGEASFPRVAAAYRKGGVLKERVRDLSNERKRWKWWSQGSKVVKGELILRNAPTDANFMQTQYE